MITLWIFIVINYFKIDTQNSYNQRNNSSNSLSSSFSIYNNINNNLWKDKNHEKVFVDQFKDVLEVYYNDEWHYPILAIATWEEKRSLENMGDKSWKWFFTANQLAKNELKSYWFEFPKDIWIYYKERNIENNIAI